MNKKIISVLFVCLFLGFVAVIDYPFIAQWINEREQSQVVLDYQNNIKNLSLEEMEWYLKEARAYNQSLASGTTENLEIPFADSNPQNSVYTEQLNMHEEGIMAVIKIPKIKLSLPVYHGTSDEVLQKGAGHLAGSSLPVGGNSTHASIAAHRGLPSKKLFTNLDQIEEGDLFYIDVLGEILAYKVYKVEIVLPEDLEPLTMELGKDLVTLITCTPYGVNTHRIYVHGTRVPYEDGKMQEASLKVSWLEDWWIVLTIALLIWMCLLLYWFNRNSEKKK